MLHESGGGMGVVTESEQWASHLNLVLGQLNEKHRRWVAGLLSDMLGHGGTKRIAEASGLDPKTIRQGRHDLRQQLAGYPEERIRRAGGGRPPLKKTAGS